MQLPQVMTWNLSNPNMNHMHRLGVGALARTCDLMLKKGLLHPSQVEIAKTKLTLMGDLKEVLGKIYGFAFQIKDGVIYIPAMFGDKPPEEAVLLELQNQLLKTVLLNTHKDLVESEWSGSDDKGKGKDKGEKLKRTALHVVTDDGDAQSLSLPIQANRLAKLKVHNPDRIDDFFAVKGRGRKTSSNDFVESVLIKKQHMIGVVTTHSAFSDGRYTIKTTVPLAIALDFVLAGVIPVVWKKKLPNKSQSHYHTILYPEVTDLGAYCLHRRHLTPTKYTELIANSPQEAVATMLIRNHNTFHPGLSRVRAATLQKVAWSGTQINCVGQDTFDLFLQEYDFDLIQVVDANFDIRRIKYKKETEGAKKKKAAPKHEGDFFYVSSPLRTHFVGNILAGQKWYKGIFSLFQVYTEDFDRILFRRPDAYNDYKSAKGLWNMIQKSQGYEEETNIINAIQFYKRALYASKCDEAGLKKGSPMPPEMEAKINNRVNKLIQSDIHELRRMTAPEQLRSFLARIITNFGGNSVLSGSTDFFLNFYNSDDPEYMKDVILLGFALIPEKSKKADDIQAAS